MPKSRPRRASRARSRKSRRSRRAKRNPRAQRYRGDSPPDVTWTFHILDEYNEHKFMVDALDKGVTYDGREHIFLGGKHAAPLIGIEMSQRYWQHSQGHDGNAHMVRIRLSIHDKQIYDNIHVMRNRNEMNVNGLYATESGEYTKGYEQEMREYRQKVLDGMIDQEKTQTLWSTDKSDLENVPEGNVNLDMLQRLRSYVRSEHKENLTEMVGMSGYFAENYYFGHKVLDVLREYPDGAEIAVNFEFVGSVS